MTAAPEPRRRRARLSWLTRRGGRRAGTILASLMAALLLVGDPGYPDRLQNAQFDAFQGLAPRERLNDSVVVVGIDERSLGIIGPWPWPREVLAGLVARIRASEPALLAVDIVFSEPDPQSPRTLARKLAPLLTGETPHPDRLARLPDSDENFAAELMQLPVVLGLGGLRADAETGTPVTLLNVVQPAAGSYLAGLEPYAGILSSLPLIDSAALGRGVLNAMADDGVVRVLPTVVNVGGTAVPSFAAEILRVISGSPTLTVNLDGGQLAGISAGDFNIPADPAGHWRLHFSNWRERPHVSAAALLRNEVPADLLRGRIAMLGFTALGLQDTVVTPLGTMPGIEVHAEAVENALDGRVVRQPAWSLAFSVALFAALAAVGIALVPRVRPATGVAVYLVLAVAVAALGMAAFVGAGLLLDVATPLLMAALVFALMLVLALNETQWQQRRLEQSLRTSREQEARLAGQLEGARRIQLGMLPRGDEILRGERRVEVAGLLDAAQLVGGDLYDFFRIGDRHLFFLVGDVSGKGLPASLFMALVKAMIKGAAERVGAEPGPVLTAVLSSLAHDNPEQLFVTLWVGALDLDSGELSWCSAGHEAPYLLRAGSPELARLDGQGGPPLCFLDDYTYATEHARLERGDSLFLFTDGITEAQSPNGEFYGVPRLEQCLRGTPSPRRVADYAGVVRNAVYEFAAGAPQADDLTAMVVRWTGPRAPISGQ